MTSEKAERELRYIFTPVYADEIINALSNNRCVKIPKAELKEKMLKYGFTAPDMTVTEFVEDFETL